MLSYVVYACDYFLSLLFCLYLSLPSKALLFGTQVCGHVLYIFSFSPIRFSRLRISYTEAVKILHISLALSLSGLPWLRYDFEFLFSMF